MINQLKCQMIGDAKDLLDARLPTHMTSWLDVKALALSLFASQDLEHEAWDFLYTAKYIWGDNLDVHYSKFIKHAKRATGGQQEFMQKTARMHFIRSLPQDLMREAGLCTFTSDDEMLRHLKKCMLFSTKPTPKSKIVTNLAIETEEEGQTSNEELEAVVSALQSFGWQKKQEPAHREEEKLTFVRYPCSLCGKHGHNIMNYELRASLLDALPEFKNKLAIQKAQAPTSSQAFKLITPPKAAQGHIGDIVSIRTEAAHSSRISHQDVQIHSQNRKPTVVMNMSHHFKLLNCISPRKARGKEVKPWVMNCRIQGLTKECIIDTRCNITAIPLCLTQKLKLNILPAPHLVVTIADGSTYNPIGMVDVDIEVVGVHTTMRALVSIGDKVLLGLDWMEEVGCILDILARQLIMTREHTQIFVQLQNVTMKAGTANLQIIEPQKPKGPQGPQFRWNNFISYSMPDDHLHIWDILQPAQVSPQPRPVHLNSFLLRVHQDIEIDPYTQHIHASHLALACPKDHYVEVIPWKQLAKQPQCLVLHGFYNRTYRGELRILLANPTSRIIKIKKGQVLARITTVKQDLEGNISPIPSTNLGIETSTYLQYQSQVLLKEEAPSPLPLEE
jgi:hypothetical protein